MKILMFDWSKCNDIGDLTEISDVEFEKLSNNYGKVYTDVADFEADFNAEIINTSIHQIRIIKPNKKRSNNESKRTNKRIKKMQSK